jgi:ABC-type glycerol-3-phosphate transport system substrate-binding protein
MDSYAGQGLLMDLTKEVDVSAMFPGIAEAMKTSEKLWYVPGQFQFAALMGEKGTLGKIDELDALVNAVVTGANKPAMQPGSGGGRPFGEVEKDKRSTLYFSQLRDLFNLVMGTSAPVILKDNKLDAAALEKTLDAIKKISDKYELGKTSQGGGMTAMFSDGGAPARVQDSVIRYSMQQTNYGAMLVNNYSMMAMTSERPDTEMVAFPGLAPDAFIPGEIAGVNGETKKKDLALAFIKTMLSADVQGVNNNSGLPVTKEGLQIQIDTVNQRMEENDREVVNFNLDPIIETLKKPVLTDSTLTDAIWTETEKLCKGETTLEKAIKDIEQNVKNYLAERA